MSATKYTGGCHCGNVRYEIETNIEKAASCNCSICSKRGWLLWFVPSEQFKLIKGDESLSDYMFGKKSVHHLFCKTCGVSSFAHGRKADGTGGYAINLRCLDDFDPSSLPVKLVDGKSF